MKVSITGTKTVKCFRTNWFRKWRKAFIFWKKFFVLAEYFEQLTDCNRYRRKISQSRRSPWRNQSYFTFPYQTNGNHATKSWTVGQVILRTALERYFRFHWNCKQLWVEARNSMPNYEIYFPIFSETIYTSLKIFSQHVLRKRR